MSLREKSKLRLEDEGWIRKDVPYNRYGHDTREGWTHPSNVYEKPVSFETAWEFSLRLRIFQTWQVDSNHETI